MFVVVLFIITAIALISWAWVKGTSHMNENHSKYESDNFLHTSAGRDHWDDWDEDAIHTEGEI